MARTSTVPTVPTVLDRLIWPLRDSRGELGAGWLVAADLTLWTAWFGALQMFRHLPPFAGLVWTLLIGGAFVWRYASRGSGATTRRRLDSVLGFGTASGGVVAAAALLVAVFGQFWDVVYRRVPGVVEPSTPAWDAYGGTMTGFVATSIIMVAVGPVMEELGFRGWIMPAISRRYGPAAGIVVSSLLFAAVHAWVGWIPYFFVAGLVFGTAVHLTGSVWTGIALHSAYNAMCVLLDPLFPTPESIAVWMDGLVAGRASAPIGAATTLGILAVMAQRIRRAPKAGARGGPL